jgi:hypothetical protein
MQLQYQEGVVRGGVVNTQRWLVPEEIFNIQRTVEIAVQNRNRAARAGMPAVPEHADTQVRAQATTTATNKEEDDGLSLEEVEDIIGGVWGPCASCGGSATMAIRGGRDHVDCCPLCHLAFHGVCRAATKKSMDAAEAAEARVRGSRRQLVERASRIMVPGFLTKGELCELCKVLPFQYELEEEQENLQQVGAEEPAGLGKNEEAPTTTDVADSDSSDSD